MSTITVPKPHVISAPPVTRAWSRTAVILLVVSLYFGSVFSPALQDDADSTHAEAAREMVVRHDYVTLHVNGVRYLEKAPLMYWLVAGSYHLFGVNQAATRVPTALAVILFASLAMCWARRAFGDMAGIYAGLFAGTTIGVYLFTRILIPEVILSLLIAATLYLFLTGLSDREKWRWYGAYTCLALAVLTKGLVAVVFVATAGTAYLILSGEWRRWREFHLAGGMALFFAIAAPWHLLAGFRNHGFFWFYFVNEHILRFLGKRYPKDYSKLPALLYWSLHIAWLFPWSMYLPAAIRDLRRNLRPDLTGSSLTFASRTRLLCWIWATIVLVFFAVSTNQEYYTFPAYFPILLLLASSLAQAEQDRRRNGWLIGSAAGTAVLSVAAGCLLLAGLWTSRNLPFVPDIGTVVAKHDLSIDTLSMSHMLDLTGESFAALRLPTVLAVIGLMVGPVLALGLRLRRRDYAATWTTACAIGLLFVAAHVALGRFEPYLSSKRLAQMIAQHARPEDKVMIYGDQAFGSSLLFYLKRPIDLVNGRTTSMSFGSTFPDAPKIYLSDSDLLRDWNSDTRVFLFVTPYMKARVDALIPSPRYVIAESSGKSVYSNRP